MGVGVGGCFSHNSLCSCRFTGLHDRDSNEDFSRLKIHTSSLCKFLNVVVTCSPTSTLTSHEYQSFLGGGGVGGIF